MRNLIGPNSGGREYVGFDPEKNYVYFLPSNVIHFNLEFHGVTSVYIEEKRPS